MQRSNEVLTLKQFEQVMDESQNSLLWRALDCIQTCVKAKTGLGLHIPIRFSMQLDHAEQKKIKKEYMVGSANLALSTLRLNKNNLF